MQDFFSPYFCWIFTTFHALHLLDSFLFRTVLRRWCCYILRVCLGTLFSLSLSVSSYCSYEFYRLYTFLFLCDIDDVFFTFVIADLGGFRVGGSWLKWLLTPDQLVYAYFTTRMMIWTLTMLIIRRNLPILEEVWCVRVAPVKVLAYIIPISFNSFLMDFSSWLYTFFLFLVIFFYCFVCQGKTNFYLFARLIWTSSM